MSYSLIKRNRVISSILNNVEHVKPNRVMALGMFRADRLSQLMKERNVGQTELARRVSISQATIWKLLNGELQGSKQMHKIARELGTTIAYLNDETDNPDPDYVEELYSSEEKEWIEALRVLPPNLRSSLLNITRTLKSQTGHG